MYVLYGIDLTVKVKNTEPLRRYLHQATTIYRYLYITVYIRCSAAVSLPLVTLTTEIRRYLMLTCNHTALHIFDFDTTINYESTHELDFDDKAVRSYVTRIVRKALFFADNQSDQFTGNSALPSGSNFIINRSSTSLPSPVRSLTSSSGAQTQRG